MYKLYVVFVHTVFKYITQGYEFKVSASKNIYGRGSEVSIT